SEAPAPATRASTGCAARACCSAIPPPRSGPAATSTASTSKPTSTERGQAGGASRGCLAWEDTQVAQALRLCRPPQPAVQRVEVGGSEGRLHLRRQRAEPAREHRFQ